MSRHRNLSMLLGALLVFAGCSSDDDEGGGGANDNGNGNDNGSGNGDGVLFGGGEGDDDPFGSGALSSCVEESYETESAPLDLYIMFDQSCSMSCPPEQSGPGLCCMGGPRPRIDQVRDAVTQFLNSPESEGMQVGIGYFGYFPSGATSCNPNDYSRPAVPMGELPGNASALVRSLNSVSPTGETPTGAAIRGACQYASQWRQQSGRAAAILTVTDGVPEAPLSAVSNGCNPTVPDAQNAAQSCANEGIPTYILGVGANLGNLNALAEAGGTGRAYLVDSGENVTEDVLQALQDIRESAAVPCDFAVPPPPSGSTLNPDSVNVTYTDANGDAHLIPRIPSGSACGPEGGWEYAQGDQSTVRLCETSCNRVAAALIGASIRGRSAKIELVYGCKTEEITQ